MSLNIKLFRLSDEILSNVIFSKYSILSLNQTMIHIVKPLTLLIISSWNFNDDNLSMHVPVDLSVYGHSCHYYTFI